MTVINHISKTYKNEYYSWRDNKDLNAAKRQEYLRRNPEAISDYDLKRAEILLDAVEMMDKASKSNSNKIGVAFETATDLGLGYAALGGITLGYLATKLNFVKNFINKITLKYPKSKNIISTGIRLVSGALGILATYPIYNSLSKIESKIHRKTKFETMEKELQDPRIFVVLNEEQKELFKQNLPELNKNIIKNIPKDTLVKEFKAIKKISKEALNYEREQNLFEKKYKEDDSFYEIPLSEKDVKNAKKDKVLLSILIKEINTKSQSYNEKMQKITNNLISMSFALGSLFALCYESLTKNLKKSSLSANSGVLLLITSTFFANWAQRRASHVGKFKAIQELKQNPEQLIYISKKKLDLINDDDIQLEEKQKTNSIKFIKDFFEHNKEYKKWKQTESYTGKDISKAMENIEISEKQLQDGKRLQKNLFKTLYKIDKNTQNYSNNIDVISESIKYPITLGLGTVGSVFGMKHLIKLRNTTKPIEIFKNSIKYIGTITLFTIPTLILNSYIAKTQKRGARISDMMTMKDLEDYRFFADYSQFIENP